MKFALVEGRRQEAQPNLSGKCPICEQPMVAKCGELRSSHWAHRSTLLCDPWWENETEWHRSWKDQFPVDWQEFVYRAATGEKHVADVRTDHEWVIEFQHSHIKPEERRSRDIFYRKLVWVIMQRGERQMRCNSLERWKQVPRSVGINISGEFVWTNAGCFRNGQVVLRRSFLISETCRRSGGSSSDAPMNRRMSHNSRAAASSQSTTGKGRKAPVISMSSRGPSMK